LPIISTACRPAACSERQREDHESLATIAGHGASRRIECCCEGWIVPVCFD
jgi:hypothetical protein